MGHMNDPQDHFDLTEGTVGFRDHQIDDVAAPSTSLHTALPGDEHPFEPTHQRVE